MTIEELSDLAELIPKLTKTVPLYSRPIDEYHLGKSHGLMEDVGTQYEGYVYDYMSSNVDENDNTIIKLCSINHRNGSPVRTVEIIKDMPEKLCRTFYFGDLMHDIKNTVIDIQMIVAMADHIKRYPEEYKTMKTLVNNKKLIEKLVKKPNFRLKDHMDLLEFASEES